MIWLGVLLLQITFFLLYFKREDKILSFENLKKNTTLFNDDVDHGKSEILNVNMTDSSFGMNFILRKGFDFPYAGIMIEFTQSKYLNVSSYNAMDVVLSSPNIRHMVVYLNLEDPNVKDQTQRLAHRRFAMGFNVDQSKKNIHLKFGDFKTPDWWYSLIHQSQTDFKDPDLSKVRTIFFLPGISPPLNQVSSFTVYSIVFSRDNTLVILYMTLFQLLLGGLFLTQQYLHNKENSPQKTIAIEYKPVAFVEAKIAKTDYSFLDYIHEKYMEAELSLKDISKATGVNQRHISETISEKFGCNFKTYVNQIRIEESKRLLIGTDLRINEIAYKVGFNSPVNFNRVFKTFTGMNPSEFLRRKNFSLGQALEKSVE